MLDLDASTPNSTFILIYVESRRIRTQPHVGFGHDCGHCHIRLGRIPAQPLLALDASPPNLMLVASTSMLDLDTSAPYSMLDQNASMQTKLIFDLIHGRKHVN